MQGKCDNENHSDSKFAIPLNNYLFFAPSVSTDQTAMIWEWKVESNSIECIHVCRGHERGLETVTVSESRQQFATGGWDCLLKIWSADISKERGEPSENGDEGTTSKKRKKEYSSASSRVSFNSRISW